MPPLVARSRCRPLVGVAVCLGLWTGPVTPARAQPVAVAVMDILVEGGSPETAAARSAMAASVIARELQRLALFRAITREELRALMDFETSRQALACLDQECQNALAHAAGATWVVTGAIAGGGPAPVLTLQLIAAATGTIERRVARELPGTGLAAVGEIEAATRELVAALAAAKSGTLVVHCAEPGTEIRLDGQLEGVTPMPPRAAPGGFHTLRAVKPGFLPFVRDIVIEPGAALTVEVVLAPGPELYAQFHRDALSQRRWSYAALGGGAALALAGIILWALDSRAAALLRDDIAAHNANPNRASPAREDLNRRIGTLGSRDSAAGAIGISGALLLGGGAWLYESGDDPGRYTGPSPDSATAAPVHTP